MKDVDEFLEHHGIKGMKWGVRRRRGSDGRVKGSATKPKAHELDDATLRSAINRMKMEREYKQLSQVTKNRQPAVDFIMKHGTVIVGGALAAVATQQVKHALEAGAAKAAATAAAKRAARKAVGG